MRGTIFYIPLDKAMEPHSGNCIVGHWWTVHPEKGVAFYAQLTGYARSEEPSPQCNSTRWIADHLQKRLWPECETRQIPVVYMAHANAEFKRLREEAIRTKKERAA